MQQNTKIKKTIKTKNKAIKTIVKKLFVYITSHTIDHYNDALETMMNWKLDTMRMIVVHGHT